jgi:6-phosphogluconolactonase
MYGNRKLITGFALAVSLWGGPAQAATYVYVSNAEDGTIGMYTMENDGTLKPGAAIEAGKLVMPMSVSPDKRFLFAAVRSQPFSAVSYTIDRATGALKLVAKAPLAESLPYISIDKSGRWLLGASYGGHKVTVNPIGTDGKVGKESQVIPTALNAHAILTDKSNQYAFVPHLGSDQVFQFRFDARTGKLSSNTPATVQMKSKTGPRHLVFSNDNKFVYLLNELTAVVTTLALDQKTGLLTQVSEASALPGDSKLQPGAPRVPTGTSGGPARDVSNDIWASDLHLTPDGKFLYAAERTGSSIGAFSVDTATGKLTFLSSTAVEKQPRGFSIHPNGKFLVVSGQQSSTISVYAIEANGGLKLLQKYPTGKDTNWVEIVDVK